MSDETPVESDDATTESPADGVGRIAALAPGAGLREFAGYENLGVLGVGGMGVVYRARQVALNRIVAIKTLRKQEMAASQDLERFRFEAEIVAQFQHPNIVQLYHIGEHEGQPFLAFEYVEGGSLAKKIDGKPQPWRNAAAIVETLARAVHAAHLRGVIHRDLTPNNVLLAADDTPRIADFGLAQMQERSGIGAESIAGTASYMAPEQAWGDVPGKAIGPTTDVYGLGAILYELLCGRPPFKASTSQKTLLMVYQDPPMPPREIVPGIPRDLEAICLRCLEKDPSRRFPSAEALADDLHRLLGGEPIKSRPVGPGERLWLWSRRNPVISLLVAALVFLIAASLGLGANKMLADARAATSERHRQEALYRNQVLVAGHAWESEDAGRAAKVLEACSPQLRSLEWYLLYSRCQGQQNILPWSGSAIGHIAFTPSGRGLAVCEQVDAVRLIDVASGKVVHELRGHDFRISPPRFSPDGKWLASVGMSGEGYWIRVWDVDSGEEVQKMGPVQGMGAAVGFSPDGTEIISLALDNKSRATISTVPIIVETWDRASGQKLMSVTGPATDEPYVMPHANAEISPDGRLFAWTPSDPTPPGTRHRHEIQICETESGRVRHTLTHPVKTMGARLLFSPDSRRLVTFGDDGNAIFWDVTSGKLIRTMTGHSDSILAAAFSPDGKTLATGGLDFRILLWNLETGAEPRILRGHAAGVRALAFDPSGQVLASADVDNTIATWNLTAAAVPTLKERAAVTGLGFSTKQNALVFSNVAGALRVWDFSEPESSKKVDGDCLTFAFSDDQSQLALISPDGQLRISTATGAGPLTFEEIAGLPALTNRGASPIVFSPDGSLLACLVGDGSRVLLLDIATKRPRHTFAIPRGKATSLAFRSDGKMLAAGTDSKVVLLWDPTSGKSIGRLEAMFPVRDLAFRPDSDDLAVIGAQNDFVQFWSSRSQAAGLRIDGHKSQVTCLTFTYDGRRLITGSADRTVRVWDTETGQELLALTDSKQDVMKVAVDADGKRLAAAAGSDVLTGEILLWDGSDSKTSDSETR